MAASARPGRGGAGLAPCGRFSSAAPLANLPRSLPVVRERPARRTGCSRPPCRPSAERCLPTSFVLCALERRRRRRLRVRVACGAGRGGGKEEVDFEDFDALLSPEARGYVAKVRKALARRRSSRGRVKAEVDTISGLFPYEPDAEQREAFRLHAEGKDVVCCMPTGSGKTAVGTFAAWRSLALGRRVFYTTPLKALSGQKRREFSKLFGDDAVGLVTGDHCIFPTAPVVVMTTEILRNVLYCVPSDSLNSPLARDGNTLRNLEAVVLDELHWISDRDRGTAWEETIIHCPPSVRIVGLSATVGGDPSVFCEWLGEARGKQDCCSLVTSSARPVPLNFYVMTQEGGPLGRERIAHLEDALASVKRETEAMSSDLEPALGETVAEDVHDSADPLEVIALDDAASSSDTGWMGDDAHSVSPNLRTWDVVEEVEELGGREAPTSRRAPAPRRARGGGPRQQRRPQRRGPRQALSPELARGARGIPRDRMARVLRLGKMVRRLHRLQWLPTISFIMSRQGCDTQVEDFVLSLRLPRPGKLLTVEERREIQFCLRLFELKHPEVKLGEAARLALTEGVAAHHAGQMPAQRALVERLFELRLVKLVFATETLAAGINMPARCVVLNSRLKNDGSGLRPLNGSELLQMAGRAGRRGMDLAGHAVLSPGRPSEQVAQWVDSTLQSGPLPLQSNFTPSYEMLCTLLQVRGLREVEAVVQRSFGAFLAARAATESEEEEEDPEQRESSVELAEELSSIRELFERSGFAASSIEEYADLCELEEKRAALNLEADRIGLALGSHSDDDDLSDLFGGAPPELDAESVAKTKKAPPSDLERHPVHGSRLRGELAKAARKRRRLRQRAAQWRRTGGGACAWPVFQQHIRVLTDVGFLQPTGDQDRLLVTPIGQAASRITRGSNMLWLGRALLPQPLGGDVAGRFGLGAPELASLVAAMTEERQPARGAAGRWADVGEAPAEALPEEMVPAAAWLSEERWRLLEHQWRHGVHHRMPLSMDSFLLAGAWTQGVDWLVLSEEARARGLADGDLYRMLRRTLEVLQGLELAVQTLEPPVPSAEPWLERVRAATDLISRSPLIDNLALEDGESELDSLIGF